MIFPGMYGLGFEHRIFLTDCHKWCVVNELTGKLTKNDVAGLCQTDGNLPQGVTFCVFPKLSVVGNS